MYMSLQNDDSKISSPVGVSHRGVNSIEEAFQIRHFEGHSPRNDFEGFSDKGIFKRSTSPSPFCQHWFAELAKVTVSAAEEWLR
jgi:hypothetical protein